MATIMVASMSSFVEDDEGGADACNQCRVTDRNKKVVFSCKSMANENCSFSEKVDTEQWGEVTVTVSCANAKKC
ncbi:hypothetical protein ACQKLP_23835 [Chitinophaga sp. NPDC101104]|uniref:hypothetical protein n=1 Tax=Chitinophaga sp. NPDC101104 TaxID=3390561 RepID=UPI003D01DAAD